MYRAAHAGALLAFACLFLPASIAFSQAAPAAEKVSEDARPNSLCPGSWALQFQITDELGLKPFNGMIASAKRHFSSHSAFRLGLQFDADCRSETGTERREYADTLRDGRSLDTDIDYQMVTMDLSYLNYLSPGSYINFFWGIGPLVKFSRSERNDTQVYYNGDPVTESVRDYSRSWSLGALGLVGVEWFLSEHFSFHSEYRASMAYGESYKEREQIYQYPEKRRYVTTINGDGWNFDSVYAILGLSVYF